MSEATRFAAELRRLGTERGMSLAQLSAEAHYSKGYLSNVENERKPVTPELARRLDQVLGANGALTGLVDEIVPCPYRGLASFGPDDARWFFGRERTPAALVARVGECRRAGVPLVVFGASGAGKSSLLRAGPVPALGRDVVVTTPTAVTRPVRGPIVVDQFEEVFTACSEKERRELIQALSEAAQTDLVVLGVRADFYSECVAHPQLLKAVQHQQFTVGAMTRTELTDAITEPARKAALGIEPGLVELRAAGGVQPGRHDGRHRELGPRRAAVRRRDRRAPDHDHRARAHRVGRRVQPGRAHARDHRREHDPLGPLRPPEPAQAHRRAGRGVRGAVQPGRQQARLLRLGAGPA